MDAAVVSEKTLKDQRSWRDFKPGSWCTTIDVRDFIVRNVTPYEGDDALAKANKEWIDCANQEAKLTSTLAQKVTTAKSVPETTAACQEWVSQQIELFSSQARKTIDATQDFTKACSQIVSDGKRD